MTLKMTHNQHMKIATILDNAATSATATPQNTADMSLQDAYTIQKYLIDYRIRRGHPVIGVKVGFTSRAKMVQMGVHNLIWGRLTEDMMLSEGEAIDCNDFVHPRVEPEIAFLTDKSLSGKITMMQANWQPC